MPNPSKATPSEEGSQKGHHQYEVRTKRHFHSHRCTRVSADHLQTLSFKKAFERPSHRSSEYSERTVRRHWGYGQSVGACIQQQAKTSLNGSAMLQRWQQEALREQPYNAIGAVGTMRYGSVTEDSAEQAEKKKSKYVILNL